VREGGREGGSGGFHDEEGERLGEGNGVEVVDDWMGGWVDEWLSMPMHARTLSQCTLLRNPPSFTGDTHTRTRIHTYIYTHTHRSTHTPTQFKRVLEEECEKAAAAAQQQQQQASDDATAAAAAEGGGGGGGGVAVKVAKKKAKEVARQVSD
jgi:hypothetical protein